MHCDCFKTQLQSVIGDGDSAKSVRSDDKIYILCEDQNDTDFAKALQYIHGQAYQKLVVFGAGGGEIDHCISNFATALHYQNKLELQFIDEYGIGYFLKNETLIENQKGKMISIVPFPELQEIELSGCRYPLFNETLALTQRLGTRNHAISDRVKIRYTKGNGLVFISHNNYHNYQSQS